ncbi:hypothetical protein P3T76_002973 [Phytophthora citrophthora]|uniref:M96 mating-specific protein family n=1 Tax=Phytophthora citrophthora TaxID=4793 RepID=A0AAD9GVU2_9STRA|nr:hypothetical protein P3T76_002973 [Phytophthora citrophthora]
MTQHASDPTEAAVLAQFVREYEPQTSPSSFQDLLSDITLDPELAQSPVLTLQEEDKQAIMAALDSYHDLNVVKPIANDSEEEDKALLKLTVQRAKATKRRNRHRQRVKQEWQTLRFQDSQLSAKLELLKQARFSSSVSMGPLNWQALATKEFNSRLQAEAQRVRIRAAIESRAVVMQHLQNMLDTEQTQENDIGLPEWGPSDVKMYENFMQELAVAYARTDAVFHDCGLAGSVPTNTSFYKPLRRHDSVRETFFESTSAFVMPKKYPNSANAMVDAMRQIHQQHPRRKLLETGEGPSDTLAIKFGTVNQCEGENVVPLSLITVQHRFVEIDRTVLVWRCLIEGEGGFAGTFLDETGWCVIRPTTMDLLEATDVRTCIHSVPIHRGVHSVEGRDEMFANAVVRSSQQDSLQLVQLMDQLLIGA